MKTSVIIPSTGRSSQLVKNVRQLLKVSPNAEVICIIEHDRDSALAMQEADLDVRVIYRSEHKGAVYGWNEGAAIATGDALLLAADDIWFHENWLEEAEISLMKLGGSGVVGFNNFYRKPKYFSDHYLVTRDYAKSNWGGVLCCPHYKHICVDMEACVHALEDGKYIYSEKSILEHRHWHYDEAVPKDATYELNNHGKEDMQIYLDRKKYHWPIDYKAVF